MRAQGIRPEQKGSETLLSRTKENQRPCYLYKIATLPAEILGVIFEYACAGTDAFPLIIGGVCSLWRDIAWSTPQLWTSLPVTISMDEHKEIFLSRCYGILHLYFANVGALTLSLELRDIDVWFWGDGSKSVDYRKVFALIFQDNPHKLGGFIFQEFNPEWFDMFRDSFQPSLLTRLTFLDLEWYSCHPPETTTTTATAGTVFNFLPVPSLTKVTLCDRESINLLSLIQLPWTQLTSLTLWTFPVNKCLNLLINECPRLKEFRCRNTRHLPDTFFDTFDYPYSITLHDLEVLDWHLDDNYWTRYLLTSVRFPSLKRLYCREAPNSLIWQMVGTFLRNSPQLIVIEDDGDDPLTLEDFDESDSEGESMIESESD